jgi:hypothetical protein
VTGDLPAQCRVLIKDRSSGLYYVGLDQWTATERKALAFTTIAEATQVITRAHLKNVQVVTER